MQYPSPLSTATFLGTEKDFSKKVSMVIKYIKSNPKYQSEIATAAMIDYHSLEIYLTEQLMRLGFQKHIWVLINP